MLLNHTSMLRLPGMVNLKWGFNGAFFLLIVSQITRAAKYTIIITRSAEVEWGKEDDA